MPGSVPFATVASATDPPDAKVTAHVTGSGERRTLTYDIRNRPDQTVTFWDSTRGGAATAIGHATGGSGTLHFTAAPGDTRRTIYAQFTLDGMSAERINVASYRPPAPTLATPRHLRVTRAQDAAHRQLDARRRRHRLRGHPDRSADGLSAPGHAPAGTSWC